MSLCVRCHIFSAEGWICCFHVSDILHQHACHVNMCVWNYFFGASLETKSNWGKKEPLSYWQDYFLFTFSSPFFSPFVSSGFFSWRCFHFSFTPPSLFPYFATFASSHPSFILPPSPASGRMPATGCVAMTACQGVTTRVVRMDLLSMPSRVRSGYPSWSARVLLGSSMLVVCRRVHLWGGQKIRVCECKCMNKD